MRRAFAKLESGSIICGVNRIIGRWMGAGWIGDDALNPRSEGEGNFID
jgi:hypothetical protein